MSPPATVDLMPQGIGHLHFEVQLLFHQTTIFERTMMAVQLLNLLGNPKLFPVGKAPECGHRAPFRMLVLCVDAHARGKLAAFVVTGGANAALCTN